MYPKKKIPVVQKNITQRRLGGEPKKKLFSKQFITLITTR